jgi:hypothetical protein
MEQMGQGMADGGIVAFSGEVDSFVEEREDRRTPFDILLGNRYRPPRNQPVTPDPTNRNIDMVTGAISTGAIPFVDANLDNQMFANIDRDVGASSPGAAPPPKTGADQTGGGAPRAAAPGVAPTAVPTFESRRSAIDQLLAPTEDIAKQVAASKNQAQGEFLMQMGAALMSTPNVGVALSKGVAAGLPGLAANRKEINAIQKDQRDYRLNLSKAQEAAAQGRDDLAFKYADLAEKAKYHAGIVASRAGGDRFITAAMAQARAQLAEVLKNPRLSRNYATPEAQSAYLNNAFNSALSILSGQGPVTPSIPSYDALPSGEAPLTR